MRLKLVILLQYSDSDIAYLRSVLPETVEDEFFDYLGALTANDVTVYAIDEGTVVFPRSVDEGLD